MRTHTSLWLFVGSLATMGVACSSGHQDTGTGVAESNATVSSAITSTSAGGRNDSKTRTPIKHVVVIVGENRSFDHVFATYKPKNGQRIDNLLSKGIVREDGTPGPNFARAVQKSAVDSPPSTYELSPGSQAPYAVLPPVLAGGATTPYVSSLAAAQAAESAALPADYVPLLLTGATGLTSGTPDTRLAPESAGGPLGPVPALARNRVRRLLGEPRAPLLPDVAAARLQYCARDVRQPGGLPLGPLPLGRDDHRRGQQRRAAAWTFNDENTREGAAAMGFYNVLQGDVPYFKSLADTYAMSDNFHQAIDGGTGANHIALGTGDVDWYSDGSGHAIAPPALEIENPDPQAGDE